MSYTEIPDDLLNGVMRLFSRFEFESTKTEDGSAEVKLSRNDMCCYQPLIKWLHFISAVRVLRDLAGLIDGGTYPR